MQSISILSSIAIVITLFSVSGFASGIGNYGQGEGSTTRVDRLYESGKSVYYAKGSNGESVQYCINDGEQSERVSRRTLKPFVGSSVNELTARLVRCDDVERPVSELLDQSEVDAIVYYLNKRYRLSLYQS